MCMSKTEHKLPYMTFWFRHGPQIVYLHTFRYTIECAIFQELLKHQDIRPDSSVDMDKLINFFFYYLNAGGVFKLWCPSVLLLIFVIACRIYFSSDIHCGMTVDDEGDDNDGSNNNKNSNYHKDDQKDKYIVSVSFQCSLDFLICFALIL